MAFGIGIETELVKEYEKTKPTRQMPVACDCWFTSNGKTIPRKMKFEDEDGLIQSIDTIEILCCEKRNYSGIPSYEYQCMVPVQGLRIEVKLIFYPETCKWIMEY